MKKISFMAVFAIIALFLTSCQTGVREDNNGNTPTAVVEKMYQAIKAGDFDTAATFNRLPDTIRIKAEGVYQEFKGNPKDKDGNVVITAKDWIPFVISKMQDSYTLESWEIVSEEISNTDPNSAKVKTTIHLSTDKGMIDSDCSFPLKRENGVWLIIG